MAITDSTNEAQNLSDAWNVEKDGWEEETEAITVEPGVSM